MRALVGGNSPRSIVRPPTISNYTENNTNASCRHIVGLCGPPGAGKSTLASQVARRVNELWPERPSCFDSQVESPEVAIVLPMDGFHLYRHQLDAMKVSHYKGKISVLLNLFA